MVLVSGKNTHLLTFLLHFSQVFSPPISHKRISGGFFEQHRITRGRKLSRAKSMIYLLRLMQRRSQKMPILL